MTGMSRRLRHRSTFVLFNIVAVLLMVVFIGLHSRQRQNIFPGLLTAKRDLDVTDISQMTISGTVSNQISDERRSGTTPATVVDDVYETNIQYDNNSTKTDVTIEATPSPDNKLCHFTEVDAFDPEIMDLVTFYPPVTCTNGTLSLVYVKGDTLRVNATKIKSNPRAKHFSHCRYRPVFKDTRSDMDVWFGEWSRDYHDRIELGDEDENIVNECFDRDGVVISKSYLYHVAWNTVKDKRHYSKGYAKHRSRYSPKEKLNVLLVGLDGMARKNFQRTMPKTRQYILKQLGAIELEKFNKVGVNTFPNLLSLLTGYSNKGFREFWQPEIPLEKVNHFFVWSHYKEAGYRTALDLEEAKCSAFHCEGRTGFHQQPVDMYTRTLTIPIDMDGNVTDQEQDVCKGDKPSFFIHNDFLLQLSTRYNQSLTPYFALSFLTLLTHDDLNKASAGDDWYLEFFKEFKRRNVLQNTIMIFFSDHGERYGEIRETYNGVVESKTPMVLFILPEWFKTKYPDVINNLHTNAKRLTSTFDLHATLIDILFFKSSSKPSDLHPGPGISLFQKVPERRSCQDAGIPFMFCNCNALSGKKIEVEIQQLVSSTVTKTVNRYLAKERDCAKVAVKSIRSIMQLSPPEDFYERFVFASDLYHVTIMATPGDAVFEAEVLYNTKDNSSRVVGTVSRLNMYRGQRNCVKKWQLRRYCYCPE